MTLFSKLSLLEVEKRRKFIFPSQSRNKINSEMDLVVSIHHLLQFFRIKRCCLLIAKYIVGLKQQFEVHVCLDAFIFLNCVACFSVNK